MSLALPVRSLDPEVKRALRVRAARHGVSMEEEVRNILRSAVQDESQPPRNLAEAIHALFAPFGGVEIEIAPREAMREPPAFR